ncbi:MULTISPECIES: nodulation protein NfeD [unclassified Lentimicrobium]|uniref:NfeD family protein n=1 Tax=unclassified Lentimicrobium TaxID=2677434 RepID=UPI0020A63509|nr:MULTISPECIES: NfeD family protein [unclassified Lentimicrobium]
MKAIKHISSEMMKIQEMIKRKSTRMNDSFLRFALCFAFFLVLTINSNAESVSSDSTLFKVYQLDIMEEIAPPVWHLTQKAFEEAHEKEYDLMLIHMNTYGGMVDAADSIRTAILNSDIPVYVLIDNNAASAGALISIACDSIYMVAGANIGAATVVNQTGEAMPDKYQSYMRSMMRSTAEATGRDPQIAQAMVDPRIKIEDVIDSSMVLTFTTSEAIANGFCEAQVESLAELLTRAGVENYEIYHQELKASDKIIRLLVNPMVSGILIMLIVGGLYFELQSPGIGFPLAASIFAAVLYFAPLYLEGLVENWEVIIFFVGVILLAIELFVVPGFGFFGISGIVLIVTSLALAMVDNDGFKFTLPNVTAIINALIVVSFSSLLGLIGSYYLSKKLFSTQSMFNLALATTQEREEGFGIDLESYKNSIGEIGQAFTVLRPSGKVMVDGQMYDAVSLSNFIEKGDEVEVVGYENAQLMVRKSRK